MLDINSLPVINIKTYQRKKQMKTYKKRINKLSKSTVSNLGSLTGGAGSSVLVLQDCSVGDTSLPHSDEANASCDLPKMLGETGAVYHTPLLVDGDILLGRACPGVELESGEQEIKMENLEEIIDEQSVKGLSNSTVSNLGSLTVGVGSSVLVLQDCSVGDTSLPHSNEANASWEFPKVSGETGAVYHASLLVNEDILLGRACPGVELESGEQEIKIENLEEIIDEQSVKELCNSTVSNLGSLTRGAGSSALVLQDCSGGDTSLPHSNEENASFEFPKMFGETGAVYHTSLLVNEDILLGRACPGVELESEEEEIKLENLEEIIDEQSVKELCNSTGLFSTVSNLRSLTGGAGSSVLVLQDCSGVELESGEEEIKLENLEEIIDEQSVKELCNSTVSNLGSLTGGGGSSVLVLQDCSAGDTSLPHSDEANASRELPKMFGETGAVYHTSVLVNEDILLGRACPGVELESGEQEIKLENLEEIIDEQSVKGVSMSSPQLGGMTDDVGLAVIGNDWPQQMLPSPLEGSSVNNFRKKLLVLDVNGLLVDIVSYASEGYNPDTIISGKAVFKRPFCDDFLQFCFEKFHVGVWSSRTRKNLDSVLEFLMGKFKCRLLFCWDQSHCTDTGFNTIHNEHKPLVLKELKKLWEKEDPDLPWNRGDYNKSNTLLLDDTPYKALRNPPYTAIFPHPFRYKAVKDNSLGSGGTLRVYLEGLTLVDNVQEYVELNPFGQRPITKTNPSWNFYLKVMNTSSSEPEEDNNSLVCEQILTPNDQHMGFEDRCTVVKTRKRPLVTTPLPSDASDTIYVEGLPLDSTNREVAHIFRPFEGYKNVRLVRKESSCRGDDPFIIGFVEFVDPDCAAAALSALDGYKVDERDPYSSYLRLQFSRSASVSRGKRQCRYYDR